jgi:hypothetical protein
MTIKANVSRAGVVLENGESSEDAGPPFTTNLPQVVALAGAGPCPGDCHPVGTGDGDIDLDDYNRIKGQLSYAGFVNNGVYYISPTDPNTGFLWDANLDCEPWGVGDGDVDLDDFNKIKGQLSWAGFVNNGVYYIAPGDPNTGFLWPCP